MDEHTETVEQAKAALAEAQARYRELTQDGGLIAQAVAALQALREEEYALGPWGGGLERLRRRVLAAQRRLLPEPVWQGEPCDADYRIQTVTPKIVHLIYAESGRAVRFSREDGYQGRSSVRSGYRLDVAATVAAWEAHKAGTRKGAQP